jgi:ubiquinone/menaquinone biosynthesis C-methylase UbiE
MGLYNKYLLPKLIDWTCSQNPTMKQRQKIIPIASGVVLEIGIGSGLNVPLYDHEKVIRLLGIDPSEELWKENNVHINHLPFEFQFQKARAEEIPADDNSFDSVVITYSMCTISDLSKTFEEVKRVLKPNGKLIFCEHGKAPDRSVVRWQNMLNPIWRQFSGGCNLNRDIPFLIQNNGFKINQLETMYVPGWKPATFNYWGTASVH